MCKIKIQTPTSNHQRRTKFQSGRWSPFWRFICWEFLGMLDFGARSFGRAGEKFSDSRLSASLLLRRVAVRDILQFISRPLHAAFAGRLVANGFDLLGCHRRSVVAPGFVAAHK